MEVGKEGARPTVTQQLQQQADRSNAAQATGAASSAIRTRSSTKRLEQAELDLAAVRASDAKLMEVAKRDEVDATQREVDELNNASCRQARPSAFVLCVSLRVPRPLPCRIASSSLLPSGWLLPRRFRFILMRPQVAGAVESAGRVHS